MGYKTVSHNSKFDIDTHFPWLVDYCVLSNSDYASKLHRVVIVEWRIIIKNVNRGKKLKFCWKYTLQILKELQNK